MSDTDKAPIARAQAIWEQAEAQKALLEELAQVHGSALRRSLMDHMTQSVTDAQRILHAMDPASVAQEFRDYTVDANQRGVLFLDALRRRGDNAKTRETEGLKPVLAFDYEEIVNGYELDRPVNYSLVRILPGDGFPQAQENGRPWVIIDPRAGHGSGIGGFKAESEVGMALQSGHPVYFVIFHPHPAPTQTLADVTAAEAVFLTTVAARHPDAPKPLVTGNCQGGWASMILAATHPGLTGPVVIAGAPLSYWAGKVGQNPFRYYGGLAGGAIPALLAADLGGGTFDGASLVLNFEGLNPAKTWWRKNYDLFADVDTGTDRFLEFEKWWSGFYYMNEAEIRWIVENLFVGNKLTAGQAVLDDGTPVDLTRVSAPVVVFASHGDNITPPQQALHWIPDLYETTEELRAHGHVIIYTLHDSIGHLGIFVSAKVANTQHKQITTVVQTIESLPPGLYEMMITQDETGTYEVEFQTRQIDDIREMNDAPEIAEEFAAVAELSDWGVKGYELFLRPWIRAMVTDKSAETGRKLHPMRVQMAGFASDNPMMKPVATYAEKVRGSRTPTKPNNAFEQAERVMADIIERNWDLYRDSRDAAMEMMFHSVYGSPFMRGLAPKRGGADARHDISNFPQVREMLEHIDKGGYAEAVVRMLILLARARGTVRRERLQRSNDVLHGHPPFDTMDEAHRNHIIHEQSLIVDLTGQEALATLPALLTDEVDRLRALNLVLDIAGPVEDMDAPTIAMFEEIQTTLRLMARGWHRPTHLTGTAAE